MARKDPDTALPSVGDSTAVSTQAAPEPTTSSVLQAGASFPWEYRCASVGDDGKDAELKVPCVATITSASRDLVWCDLVPSESLSEAERARLARSVGFPRHVHILNAVARRALETAKQ